MRKKQTISISKVRGAQNLQQKMQKLSEAGYTFLLPKSARYTEKAKPKGQWDKFLGQQLQSSTSTTGTSSANSAKKTAPYLYFSSGGEAFSGVVDCGTKGKGYIEWGFGNHLPNVVAILSEISPYVAAGLKFNTDLLSGKGPKPYYNVVQYVGGNIAKKKIAYADAGAYIKGKIADKQRELLNVLKEQDPNQDDEKTASPDSLASIDNIENIDRGNGGSDNFSFDGIKTALCQSLQEDIDNLRKDYEAWAKTNAELQSFLERNNLEQVWLSLAVDMNHFDICFPEIQLNQKALDEDGNPVPSERWKPKATGLSYRSCHTTRFERMDDQGRIRYVYCTNRWLDANLANQTMDTPAEPAVAIPVLDVAHPLVSLQESVRNARTGNVAESNRPTRFVLPSYYPTAGRPYYPIPAWHSIFGGDIYEYLSTIISDRYARKKNSSVIGRIIYIHSDYLAQLYVQASCKNDGKKQAELRDVLYDQINTFLSNRDNAGQSLLGFKFTGNDGKEHNSFEVVEIESSNKSTADANEKETAEISSIVFMAMGLDARLMGSSPLSLYGSNGGTDIRERFLARQILKSPTTQVMLKALDVISHFNEWDDHLDWDIEREVMTTLDRSKTGVTSSESE